MNKEPTFPYKFEDCPHRLYVIPSEGVRGCSLCGVQMNIVDSDENFVKQKVSA